MRCRCLLCRKAYYGAKHGEQVVNAQKHLPLWCFVREKFLQAKCGVWGAECVTSFWLAGGEVIEKYPRNPVLSLRLSSSTWMRALGLQNNSEVLLYTPLGIYCILPWVYIVYSPGYILYTHLGIYYILPWVYIVYSPGYILYTRLGIYYILAWVYIVYSPGWPQNPAQSSTLSWLLLPCLCIPSLPRLITIWTCPLEVMEDQGSLFPTNKKWDIERIWPTSSTGSCLVSISSFPGQVPTTKNEKWIGWNHNSFAWCLHPLCSTILCLAFIFTFCRKVGKLIFYSQH